MKPSPCPDCRNERTICRLKVAKHHPAYKGQAWLICYCTCGAVWQKARLKWGRVVSGRLD